MADAVRTMPSNASFNVKHEERLIQMMAQSTAGSWLLDKMQAQGQLLFAQFAQRLAAPACHSYKMKHLCMLTVCDHHTCKSSNSLLKLPPLLRPVSLPGPGPASGRSTMYCHTAEPASETPTAGEVLATPCHRYSTLTNPWLPLPLSAWPAAAVCTGWLASVGAGDTARCSACSMHSLTMGICWLAVSPGLASRDVSSADVSRTPCIRTRCHLVDML